MPGGDFRTVMFQSWNRLTFLHWRYAPAHIRPHVPAELELDLFDGSAWVGITPFLLDHLRPALFPTLPWISRFAETNCRTYVRDSRGRTGIWFFSLECARMPAVLGARASFGLPYQWSRMGVAAEGSRMSYRSDRRWPDRAGRTRIEIEHGGVVHRSELTDFLAERYRLFSTLRGRLVSAAVAHEVWPLEQARVIQAEQTLTSAAGLPEAAGPEFAHFSPGVYTRVGAPEPVG